MYIDRLDDIVNEYDYKYYSTIKMKHVSVKSSTYFDFGVENNDKDPKLKTVIMSEYQNIKTFL